MTTASVGLLAWRWPRALVQRTALVALVSGSIVGSGCNSSKPTAMVVGEAGSGAVGIEGSTGGSPGVSLGSGEPLAQGQGGAGSAPVVARPPAAGADAGVSGRQSALDAGVEASTVEPVFEVTYDAEGCPLVPNLKLERVAMLSQTGMLLAQAVGDERIFVAERPGRILLLRPEGMDPTPFLDMRSSVAPLETERGLLSMALHPQFEQTGRFFVFYTRAVDDPMTPDLDTLGDLVVAEGQVSFDNADRAQAQLRALFTVPKEVRYHNGGMLAFGPDGYLYVSTGEDGRIYGEDADTLQQVDHKLGKILRIDVDAPQASVPGNIAGGDIHVWDYGLRNPWRMSFDRVTGDLYIGDVGEATYDEILYEPLGQGGRNYGWGVLEGNQCNAPSGVCETSGMTPPILAIPHDGPGSVDNECRNDFEQDAAECNRAVVGGYVYRGAALPELDGRYFYGDNIQNTVKSFIVRDGEVVCSHEHTGDLVSPQTRIAGMVSFSEDAAGELYILDLFGNVYRIERQ